MSDDHVSAVDRLKAILGADDGVAAILAAEVKPEGDHLPLNGVSLLRSALMGSGVSINGESVADSRRE